MTPLSFDYTTEYGVRIDLALRAQQALIDQVLPVLRRAIDDVTVFMVEAEDDDEVRHHLRELATETVINELVSLLTHDTTPISSHYTVTDEHGIGYDTLLACRSELSSERVRTWFADALHLTPDDYDTLRASLPDKMSL